MNKRIRELAEQAGLRFTQLMSNPMVPVVDGKETDLEKFAELIVRECCGAANEWYQKHNELHWDPAQHIRNHFGAES